jgi:4-hydroxy-tetrahydrodipicolinate reductase
MATDVIVCGAAGRMGRLLVSLGHAHAEITIAAAVEPPGTAAVGRDAGEIAGIARIGVPITDSLAAVARRDRVILDFTAPQAAVADLRIAVDTGAAIVIGTTGFDPAEEREVLALGARTRTIVAPNMSLGINVLLGLVRQAARALGPSFDVEIVELHHRYKKDAPSGTALALARAAADALARPFPASGVFARHGQVGERGPTEIGVQALRAGDAAGEHTVLFGGIGERIELTHRAQSRECFAAGALRAARWLAGQPNGLYSMADVLGLA